MMSLTKLKDALPQVKISKLPPIKRNASRFARDMLCRLEGALIAAMLVSAYFYAQGLINGRNQGIEWIAINMGREEAQYQKYSDQAFNDYENEVRKAR